MCRIGGLMGCGVLRRVKDSDAVVRALRFKLSSTLLSQVLYFPQL